MPNIIAYIVFYSWPLVVYLIFRRQPMAQAIAWSMILGFLFLPERVGFDLPAVPTIAKSQLTILTVGVMCWLKLRADRQATRYLADPAPAPATPKGGKRSRGRLIAGGLVALLLITPVLTVLTNGDPIYAGPRVLPGLRPYDVFSILGWMAFIVLPFWVGRRFLDTPDSHVVVLKIFCIALMGYSLLALWEIRMSPQLNRIVYGFTASSFLQHMRAGGFRPLVFINHGLALGIVLSMCVLSAAAVWRHTRQTAGNAMPWLFCTGWLLFTLVLAKSVGALVICLILLPFILFGRVRAQLLVAGILAGVVVLYPMLRGAGYVPTEAIHDIALGFNEDRAQSLKFRLDNEDQLLAKANEKPLLGWGTWGRNMIYDPVTGADRSVTDGAWIIFIGTSGWLGYIARFGLLTAPILLLALRKRRIDISPGTAGLALVLTANLVDLLPNASLLPITWLLAGALMGRYIAASEAAHNPASAAQADPSQDAPQSPRPPALKKRKRRGGGVVGDLPAMTELQVADGPVSTGLKQRRRR